MDLCHLKHSGLEEHVQTYRRRVVLQSDNVQDESGHRALFTEDGASASQKAAARFVDTISRLPDMGGEANDAVLACTQVHRSEAPRVPRLPEKECLKVLHTTTAQPKTEAMGLD